MFETRWARYGDPRNLVWEFDVDMNHASKWERHAWSAYLDLVATESERDLLLERVRVLEGALRPIVSCYGLGQPAEKFTEQVGPLILDARAALAAKGE
jgi:hypothetical protein